MLRTFKAVVRGNRIEWLEASEESFPAALPVEALITPLQEQSDPLSAERKGERRLAALKKLASINAFASVANPEDWQRETRADRELPGRTSDAD